MSAQMTEHDADTHAIESAPVRRRPARSPVAIVPKNSIAGRALVAVVAIMTFLASLTTGGVMLMRASAAEWQSDVAREVTIQVRPAQGRDIEADVTRAADIARAFPGIADVRPYSKEESARLLEPWLGQGSTLDELPVPRMVVVRVAAGASPDFAQLRKTLGGQVPTATLDDHRAWIERIRAMARTSVVAGIGILILMLAATVFSVVFATRGAMATNRPIVEVLHFIGAKDSFIAGQFQRHFLALGLEGGAIGGGAAIALFALAGFIGDLFWYTGAKDQVALLFGNFSMELEGYVVMLGQIVLVAIVTAATSRQTVNRALGTIE
jgi:cell division transport system permease protein